MNSAYFCSKVLGGLRGDLGPGLGGFQFIIIMLSHDFYLVNFG